MSRSVFERWELGALALAYLLCSALHILWDLHGALHWEEALQPSAALLLADGFSLKRLVLYQYTPFCGGCTVEALLFLPLGRLLDGALVGWKLVPLGFGLAILAMVYRWARAVGGRAAGLSAGTVLVLAPSYYQLVRVRGWGNHFESAVFVLALLGLWVLWVRRGGRWLAFAIGLVAGLGFWFCYSTAFVLPVLALLALWVRPRRFLLDLGAGLPGLVLGLLPWGATQAALRSLGVVADTLPWWSLYDTGLAGNLTPWSALGARISDASGPTFWRLSVHGDLGGAGLWVGFVVWAAFMLALAGCLALGAGWLRRRDTADARGSLALGAGSLFVTHLVLNWVVTPVLCSPTGFTESIALRYVSLSFPLLAVCVGLAVGWLWPRGRAARTMACLLLTVTTGSGLLDLALSASSGSELSRVARLSAASPSRTFCGRVPGVWVPADQPAQAFLDVAIRDAPTSPAARRLSLFELGHGLGYRVIRRGAQEWGGTVDGLADADRSAFLEGAACTLLIAMGTELRSWQPTAGPPPEMGALLAALGPEAGAELTQGLWSLHVAGVEREEAALAGLNLGTLATLYESHPGYALGLARLRGRHGAWQRARSVDALPDLLNDGRGTLPDALYKAQLHGVGCMAGERWGHAPHLLEPALIGLDAPARAVVMTGFERCAARAYRWPADTSAMTQRTE